jgi:uncharacterized protein
VHPQIEQHRVAIAEICRRFKVQRLEVFGSAARGDDFDPARSDVDLLVEFELENDPPSLGTFFDLRDALATLIGRPVDLVMSRSIRNPFVRKSIEQRREPLYAA